MTKQGYNDVREQIGIQNNICAYLKNIKEVMDVYPQLKEKTLQDAFQWLLDRQAYWENKIKESCNIDSTRPTEVDSVNEIDYSEVNEGIIHMDTDGEKLGLTYLDRHRNSDRTATINCSHEEPEKDLVSDTFEVSLPTLQVSYDRSQCIYGPDSKMLCAICSQLCPERANALKKANIKVEYLPTEKNSSNG